MTIRRHTRSFSSMAILGPERGQVMTTLATTCLALFYTGFAGAFVVTFAVIAIDAIVHH